MQGWANMINAGDPAYCLGDEAWIGQITHQHVVHPLRPKLLGLCLGMHASAQPMTRCQQLGQ
jgi:hypothetical protein